MPRDEHLEAAMNALAATLPLADFIYKTTADSLDDLARLHAALERARAALREAVQMEKGR